MQHLKDIGLPFLNDIKNINGNIYLVGGIVRDFFLNKPSKDLDIVITNVDPNTLKKILTKYGKIDIVGESFGVIKFKQFNTSEEIDIALPRKEMSNGQGGYKGFDVNVDHNLSIDTDLGRRDTKFNSMAYDLINHKLIDPFNGLNDIITKKISATNPNVFFDDPLRSLRIIAQASRFTFTIEGNTFKMIQDNASSIAEISKERILIEFDKIVHKGDPKIGAQLLVESNLYEHIFGTKFTGEYEPFGFVKKMSEMIFWLIQGFAPKPSEFYKKMMKGDIPTTAEIKALEVVMSNPVRTEFQDKWAVFEVNRIAPSMLTSYFIMNELDNVIYDFREKYPISYKELAVNGNDLMALGFKDQEIGFNLKKTMDAIYSDTIQNNRDEILKYITKTLL
jgi:tRNA nucleotidyltransferase/poly(A) polymerase